MTSIELPEKSSEPVECNQNDLQSVAAGISLASLADKKRVTPADACIDSMQRNKVRVW